jgi:sialidase-1
MTTSENITKTDVFIGGTEGHAVYRIPSIVITRAGVLLALCEGRKSISDHSENTIVLKRGTDNGDMWEPLRVIARMGRDSLNNPQALIVRETGRVIVFFQNYPYPSNEHRVSPGLVEKKWQKWLGIRVLRSYEMHSDDDGVTWSLPRDITAQVKRPSKVTTIASGPGNGIELRRGEHAGRLVMPFNEGPYGKWRVYVAYSDDQGKTWTMGNVAPESGPGHANEVQVVELSDGSILLNARTQGGTKHRKIATSKDGGQTWSSLTEDLTLIEPACQGSIIRHSDPLDGEKNILLFSNPASMTRREAGTIRASLDDGKSWPFAQLIEPGNFAYSSLVVLPDESVGCLYETGTRNGYEKIVFARCPVDWIA